MSGNAMSKKLPVLVGIKKTGLPPINTKVVSKKHGNKQYTVTGHSRGCVVVDNGKPCGLTLPTSDLTW